MIFGLSFEKVLIIAIIAAFLIGPQKLPQYAASLARLARRVRQMADSAQDRVREEMGPEFEDLDWRKMDPRQYDPRRIIREALLDDEPVATKPPTISQSAARTRAELDGLPVPFDPESTYHSVPELVRSLSLSKGPFSACGRFDKLSERESWPCRRGANGLARGITQAGHQTALQ
jgi:sec-independent protein translocase protein TatB